MLIAVALLMLGCTASTEQGDAVDQNEAEQHQVFIPLQIPTPAPVTLAELRIAMFPNTPDTSYDAMPQADRVIFATTIATLWQGVTTENYSELAWASASIGFELQHLVVDDSALWLLREDVTHRRGRGVYLFRTGAPLATSILLEAPHVYFDIGTGAISVAAFLADPTGRSHALFGNSSHRYRSSEITASGDCPADPAHNASHPLHLATVAALQFAKVTVVQLHGFGASAAIPASYAAIVSAGMAAGSTVTSADVAGALVPVLPGTAARYPEQTAQLGATTNVQGQYAREHGMEFVSIELSAAVRTELAASVAAAGRLGVAIAAAVPN